MFCFGKNDGIPSNTRGSTDVVAPDVFAADEDASPMIVRRGMRSGAEDREELASARLMVGVARDIVRDARCGMEKSKWSQRLKCQKSMGGFGCYRGKVCTFIRQVRHNGICTSRWYFQSR